MSFNQKWLLHFSNSLHNLCARRKTREITAAFKLRRMTRLTGIEINSHFLSQAHMPRKIRGSMLVNCFIWSQAVAFVESSRSIPKGFVFEPNLHLICVIRFRWCCEYGAATSILSRLMETTLNYSIKIWQSHLVIRTKWTEMLSQASHALYSKSIFWEKRNSEKLL